VQNDTFSGLAAGAANALPTGGANFSLGDFEAMLNATRIEALSFI